MATIKSAIAIFLAICSLSVLAGNAAPLGMELGVATLAQVKQSLGGRTPLEDGGINKFSGGSMLKGNGAGLEVEGLKEIVFIFDKSEKLAGVLMTMPKHDFKRTLDMLAGKYKVIQKNVPFVGNSFAKLRQGDSIIELEAPHLSFDMSLRYLSNQLVADFKKQSAAEAAAKQRKQAGAL